MKNDESKREIPTPQGGGSWTFDEAKWAWVSTDPALVPAQDSPAVLAETNNEVEKE